MKTRDGVLVAIVVVGMTVGAAVVTSRRDAAHAVRVVQLELDAEDLSRQLRETETQLDKCVAARP